MDGGAYHSAVNLDAFKSPSALAIVFRGDESGLVGVEGTRLDGLGKDSYLFLAFLL